MNIVPILSGMEVWVFEM